MSTVAVQPSSAVAPPAPVRRPRKASRWQVLRSLALIVVPVFVAATLITFLLGQASGLDPAAGVAGDAASPEMVARIRHDFGLDRPVAIQYLAWMAGLARGDFGVSWFNGVPVAHLIAQRLPISLSVAGAALVIGVVLGSVLGIAAAVRRGSWLDRGVTAFASLASALPPFVVAIVLILVFSLWLNLLPAAGYIPFSEDPAGWLRIIAIPAAALSVDIVADLSRQLRTGLVTALSENYVTGAVVRGLSPRRILFVHVLRNGAGPALSVLALRVPMLIGGAVVTETIFTMPGIGKMAADSALRGDVPVVQGTLVVSILIVLACNLVINLLLGLLQPATRRKD
ncbi:ABC transporter permease [Novosphingobium flavum]|uniref:ABC transporter permease n=1 Tax=Novosphingobium flavum TaxID=1778672 RepID=A0A7X1FTH3_9SPHN|nr:ABC transporter permease [Novosphingobium flavum]MBC2666663.1 ABC transporter permease [Novosphingobium flavum]